MENLYLTAQVFADWRAQPHEHVLGIVRFADQSVPSSLHPDIPYIHIPARALEEKAGLYEIWRTSTPPRHRRQGSIHYSVTESLLWGCLSSVERPGSLIQITRAAYDEVLDLLAQQDMPHLYRMWNYIPAINRLENDTERYRLFNQGRQEAFRTAGLSARHSAAATAVGTDGNALCVTFLAGKQQPLSIENPRQISAYHYPPQYGSSPPVFSRAGLVRMQGQGVLFISGTACIVGHRSLHVGDVRAQTRETLANIAALLEKANQQVAGMCFNLSDLDYKVYLRHAGDAAAVADELQNRVGKSAWMHMLQAAICRRELLVEIEAVARRVSVHETTA